MSELHECPRCKGSGRMKYQVEQNGETTNHEMSCPDCYGSGKITQERLDAINAHLADWCSCGNPSGDVDFYGDGEHDGCHKHHYRCRDCGGIIQIG